MLVMHTALRITLLEVPSRAWIAQSVEHQTFNLRVQGSSPCSGGSMHARTADVTMLRPQVDQTDYNIM